MSSLTMEDCIRENLETDDPSLALTASLSMFLSDKNTTDEAYELLGKKIKENIRPILLLSISNQFNNNGQISNSLNSYSIRQQENTKSNYNRYASIVYRGFRALKHNLTRFAPSQDTIQFLDEVCKEVSIQIRDEHLLKPALYLRSLLSKLSTKSKGRTTPVPQPKESEMRSKSPFEDEIPLAPSLPDPSGTSVEHSSSVTVNIPSNRIIPNFLVFRYRFPNAPKKKKNTALLHCDLFSGAIEILIDSRGKRDIVYDDCFSCSDWPEPQKIRLVEDLKQKELKEATKKTRSISNHGIDSNVFGFKYYIDQVPLELQQNQLSAVFDKISEPVSLFEESLQEKEERMASLYVTIKIMMDQYCTGEPLAIERLLFVMLEMMESMSVETQCCAFDLILNLSIHAQLLEDIFPSPLEDNKSKIQSSDSPGSLRMGIIIDDLSLKLKELILWVIHKRVKSSKVWESALNCFLYFSVADGIIDRTRVLEVDIRFFPGCIRNIRKMSDTTKHYVIRMMMNQLYPILSSSVFLKALSEIGGINWILSLYSEVRSQEARDNLFVIIYDYIIIQLASNKKIQFSAEQSDLIFEFLKSLDTSQYVPVVFKQAPKKFVERFVRFVYIEELKKDPEWLKVFGALDKTLLVASLYDLEKIAQNYLKFEPEFQQILERQKKSSTEKDMNVLLSLIKSGRPDLNRQACIWIFELMNYTLSEEYSKAPLEVAAQIKRDLDNVLKQLMVSNDKDQRKIFLFILEKIILEKQYKLIPGSSRYKEDIAKFMEKINDHMSKWLITEEKDNGNLSYVVDILFHLVSIPANERSLHEIEYPFTTQYHAATSHSRYLFKRSLLNALDINILKWVFLNLTQQEFVIQRGLICYWMLECITGQENGGKLEQIGGMAFVKEIITNHSSIPAYLASQYMVNQLAVEKPQQFQALLKKLSSRMNITQEELTANAYVLIRAIMGLGGAKNKS